MVSNAGMRNLALKLLLKVFLFNRKHSTSRGATGPKSHLHEVKLRGNLAMVPPSFVLAGLNLLLWSHGNGGACDLTQRMHSGWPTCIIIKALFAIDYEDEVS